MSDEESCDWEKKNLVGKKDRHGCIYDLWVCKVHGTEYRRYTLGWNPPICKLSDKSEEKVEGEK